MTANISAARPKPNPQAAYPEIRRDPRDGHRVQTRLNTGPPGFSLPPGPASAPLQGQVRGTGGAKTRPGGRGSPRTSSRVARSCLRKGPTARWQIAPSPARPSALPRPQLHCNCVGVTLEEPELPEGNAKRETFGTTPCLPPRHPSSSPGPGLVSEALSPSSEPVDSPPPYSPPLRTKKAAGNPGLAGVQVTSCFLMGSNSD